MFCRSWLASIMFTGDIFCAYGNTLTENVKWAWLPLKPCVTLNQLLAIRNWVVKEIYSRLKSKAF